MLLCRILHDRDLRTRRQTNHDMRLPFRWWLMEDKETAVSEALYFPIVSGDCGERRLQEYQ
jgi:hypothetical protein